MDTNGPFGGFAGLRTNDSGGIAFNASLDTGVQGIFTGPDPALHAVATDAGPYQNLSFYNDINSSGRVVFVAHIDGTARQGIFDGPDPVANALVTNDGPYFYFDAVALNDSGMIAFMADLDEGGGGIFIGPDAVADKVIGLDDPLFGSTVTALGLFDGLNDRGDIAFSYYLADGRQGVAIAVVPEPGSLVLLAPGGVALLRPGRRRARPRTGPPT